MSTRETSATPTFTHLEKASANAEALAGFGKTPSNYEINYLQERGFSIARALAAHCLKWLWCQWLLGEAPAGICERVEKFVERGMEMQMKSSCFQWRPLHDLYLLHCGIFASTDSQLEKLAKQVVDTSGYKGTAPQRRFGELYASAWCGMLKYSILGDYRKAADESEMIWSAYRDPAFAGATKPLVTPWLKQDWDSFEKQQRKDFKKLWERGLKEGWGDESNVKRVVEHVIDGYPLEQRWCWAHCGMALLAYRRGIKVANDPFWFPAHALSVVDYARNSSTRAFPS